MRALHMVGFAVLTYACASVPKLTPPTPVAAAKPVPAPQVQRRVVFEREVAKDRDVDRNGGQS